MPDVRATEPLRVLLVHRGVLTREAEAAEVEQLAVGLLLAAGRGSIEVSVSDCRWVYRAVLHDGEVRLCRTGLLRHLRDGVDVAHVHMPVPVQHLLAAVALRLHGVPVVLSPMGMLGDDFGRSTWFRGRRTLFAHVKPATVLLLRLLWGAVAQRFVCLGPEEVERSHLPPGRSAVLPWPLPLTDLGRASPALGAPPLASGAGPVAFVSRFDVQRKGIDRLCGWLEACAAELPRPAAVLLAPRPAGGHPRLDRLVAAGLLEWDGSTTGVALAERLRRCRAVMLLSRFEAQPRALREAAALGLPTICTDTGNFRAVVGALGKGALVDGDDPAAIQAAFVAVAGASRSVSAARELFDPVRVGAFLLALLVSAAQGRPFEDADYYRSRVVAAR